MGSTWPRPPGLPRLAALIALSIATGFGGLLFEIVCIREATPLLGAGSLALGLVAGFFLLGLGLGSRLLPGRAARGRAALGAAGMLYAAVALALVLAREALSSLEPGPLAMPLCAALVLAVAFLMGGALPLVIAELTRQRGGRGVGLLQGANLLGSVLGAGLGAACLIPEWGLREAGHLAAGAYLLAALLCFLSVRRGAGVVRAATRLRLPGSFLVAAGFATLLLEVWLPRRLVFFFGSYLPTLSGSLIAILLGLAIGSFLASRIPAGASGLCLLAALGVALSTLAVEALGPFLSTWTLRGPWRSLATVSLAPTLLLLPASLPLGAILPRVLEDAARGEGLPPGEVGRGFYLFSIGAVLGSLVVPYAFLLPEPLRLLPGAAALPLLLASRRPLPSLLGLAALLLALLPFHERPLLDGARYFPPLGKQVLAERSDRITTATVVEDHLRGERLLYTDEFSAAGGVSSSYMRALGVLPLCYGPGEGELALLCLGTGTTAAALARLAGERPLHVVEISPAVLGLASWFPDAFAAWTRAPGLRVHRGDGRHFIESSPPGSLGALTLEPLLPQAPGSVELYSEEFYRAARRALRRGGVCLQWVPTHALREKDYLALLGTFISSFPSSRVFVVDQSTLLLGVAGDPGEPRAVQTRDSYLCGLWSREDLEIAEVASGKELRDLASGSPRVVDGRPFLERSVWASRSEVLSWLPANLALLARATAARPGTALERARRLRLSAKAAMARQLQDPRYPGFDRAVRELGEARELLPGSTLLWREQRAAEAALRRLEGMTLLRAGEAAQALRRLDRVLALGGADLLVLAARTEALWRLGRKSAGLAAYADLCRALPRFAELPQIARERATTFASLCGELSRKARAPLEPAGRTDELAAAWLAARPWARLVAWRRPALLRWELLRALRRGGRLSDAALESLIEASDPAGLEQLLDWVGGDAARRRILLRCLPADLPLPRLARQALGGELADREALLRCLEGRKDGRELLIELLDRLVESREDAAGKKLFERVWIELLRQEPRAASILPDLPAATLRLRIRKLRLPPGGK